MQIGRLTFSPISDALNLVAKPIQQEVNDGEIDGEIYVAAISPDHADTALVLTHMEYGGITPLGLPRDWTILIDEKVLLNKYVVIGGGVRGSKILVGTKLLETLGNTDVLNITKPSLSSV